MLEEDRPRPWPDACHAPREDVVPFGVVMPRDRPAPSLVLREVVEADLAAFLGFQLDPEANRMAAFTARDPADRQAFTEHWHRILADPTTINRTILWDGAVVGSVSSYEDAGRPEVTYWIGRAYWGLGVATRALSEFLQRVQPTRPIFARVAMDNLGSRRVLEKCGFRVIGESKGFANARGAEIGELTLELGAGDRNAGR
jgi:RimJ/RimL family protein N-acetyltransferase